MARKRDLGGMVLEQIGWGLRYPVSLDAETLRLLRGELARVRDEVLALPMSEFAVSLRTNAVISVAWPLPERRDTMLIRDASSTHIPIDPSMKTLGDAFGHMVESLLRLTEGAADDDVVEVLDV